MLTKRLNRKRKGNAKKRKIKRHLRNRSNKPNKRQIEKQKRWLSKKK